VGVAVDLEGEPAADAAPNVESNAVLIEAEAICPPKCLTGSAKGREAGQQVVDADNELSQGAILLIEAGSLIGRLATQRAVARLPSNMTGLSGCTCGAIVSVLSSVPEI
jgi:hypothetical protein